MRMKFNYLRRRIKVNDPYDVVILPSGHIAVLDRIGSGGNDFEIKVFNQNGALLNIISVNDFIAHNGLDQTKTVIGFLDAYRSYITILRRGAGSSIEILDIYGNLIHHDTITPTARSFTVYFDKILIAADELGVTNLYSYDVNTGSLEKVIPSIGTDVTGIGATPSGTVFVCDAEYDQVYGYDLQTGKKVYTLTGFYKPMSVRYIGDGSICVYDLITLSVYRIGQKFSEAKLVETWIINSIKRILAINQNNVIFERYDGKYFFFGANGTLHPSQNDGLGVIGDQNINYLIEEPIEVPVEPNSIKKWIFLNETIDFGSFILKNDGRLYYYGGDFIGTGTRTEFTQITPIEDIKDVYLDDNSVYIVRNDGRLFAFGSQIFYSLGNGVNSSDIIPPSNPVQVNDFGLPIGDIKKISCAGEVIFVLFENGDLWGWGIATKGQFGFYESDGFIEVPRKIHEDVIMCATNGRAGYIVTPSGFYSTGNRWIGILWDGVDDLTSNRYGWELCYKFNRSIIEIHDIDIMYGSWPFSGVLLKNGRGVLMVGDNNGGLGIGNTDPGVSPFLAHEGAIDFKTANATRSAILMKNGTVWIYSCAPTPPYGDASVTTRTLYPVKVKQSIDLRGGAYVWHGRIMAHIDPVNGYLNIIDALGSRHEFVRR